MGVQAINFASMKAASGGGSYDSDAQAYFTALPSDPGTTFKDAWNTFVVSAKADGYYTKFIALYPLPGTSAGNNAVNAKNPGTFDITWSGTITHDSNGFTGNGGAVHGSTGITPSTHMTLNDTHLAVYCRTTAASSNPDMGCIATDRINLACRIGSNAITEHGSVFIVSANSDGQGFFVTSRRSNTDLELYKNGSSMATNTSAGGGSLPNTVLAVGGSQGQGGSNHNIAFASAGSGLTDTEVSNFYTAIQAFQTALSRNV